MGLTHTGFVNRSLRNSVHLEVLRLVYFRLKQSVLQYGIIFWDSSAHTEEEVV